MAYTNLFPLSKSWADFSKIVSEAISNLNYGAIIVEIGGGANPYLTKEQVVNFQYIVIDVNNIELSKSKGNHYEKICADITLEDKDIKCDLIITNMLLEHITDPNSFHKACFKMLNEHGKAIHFFATKYSPASILNLILPEFWCRQLLYAVQKRNWETEGKFPAYYKWCVGPTKSQIKKFRSLGFMVGKYNGYLGSGYLKEYHF